MNDDRAESHIREWIARSIQGDEDAFRLLFDSFYTMIYHYCYRLTLNAQTAQDLAQVTFIKAARGLASYQNHTSFKNWLFKIASNAATDWFRRQKRESSALENFTDRHPAHDPATPALHARVRQALGSLSPKLRQAAVLVYYEGMNHREAASVMGCAEGTVSWYANQARRQLKKKLEASNE